jgi:hypothetical protein
MADHHPERLLRYVLLSSGDKNDEVCHVGEEAGACSEIAAAAEAVDGRSLGMSTTAAVLGTNCLVEELVEGGVPEARAYAFARLLADVQHPGFDRELAYQDLVTAGYPPELADAFIKGAVLALRRNESQFP